MASNRPNRKATDEEIIRLNSVGLSLRTISSILGCQRATISERLRNMGIAPADTRRSFMEDIVKSLSADQQEWLVQQLTEGVKINGFVRNLIIQAYKQDNPHK